MSRPERPLLVVEDNHDDVFLLQRAFKRAGLSVPIHVARDGREAMHYLRGEGDFRDRARYPLPIFVLLDLKLPFFTGLQLLEWIRDEPALKRLPVVILTSSSQPSDINRAYDLGANSYLVKPSSIDLFERLAGGVKLYWLELNQSPVDL